MFVEKLAETLVSLQVAVSAAALHVVGLVAMLFNFFSFVTDISGQIS
jgi:hypothetical protein